MKKLDLRQIVGRNLTILMSRSGGISQNALAKKCKVPQRTIGRIMNAEVNCTLGMIDELARALRVEPWTLLLPDLNAEDGSPRLAVLSELEEKIIASVRRLPEQQASDIESVVESFVRAVLRPERTSNRESDSGQQKRA